MNRLANKRILLTRPQRQSRSLCDELEKSKAIVYLAPLIHTEAINKEGAREAISQLTKFDWLVFTSANGVEYFKQRLLESKAEVPEHVQVAVIGRATAFAVNRCGWRVSLLPESASSEGLLQALQELDLKDKKFALFVAEKTRDILPAALAGLGAEVTQVTLYRTVPDPDGILALNNLPWKEIDAAVFMSGSAAEVFAANLPAGAAGSRAKYCAVGASTAQRMKQLGMPADIVADEASTEGIVRALEKALADN